MNNNKSEWNIEELLQLSPEDKPKWNASELLEFCPIENTDKAKIFFTTLQGKIDRIYYAREQITNQSIPESSDFFGEFRLQSLIYLETIAYNLHSLPDVMAHIIVTIILKPLSEQTQNTSYVPKEDKFININSIKTIIEKLENNPDESWKKIYYENLLKSINALIKSQEFKYVQAFVNTVKHRNLIYEEFLMKFGKDEKQSWKFDGFEKDKETFNKIEHQELFNYADSIGSLEYCGKMVQWRYSK